MPGQHSQPNRQEPPGQPSSNSAEGGDPLKGWVVRVDVPGETKKGRHYIVAVAEAESAMAAVQKVVGPEHSVSLGAALADEHMRSRAMKSGDVIELGSMVGRRG